MNINKRSADPLYYQIKEDRPVEYFKAICRGDRYKFAFESHRNGVKIKAIVR